MVNSSNSIK